MAGNVRNIDSDEDIIKCDICEVEKPRKEFYSSINVCNRCIEESHCMSIIYD